MHELTQISPCLLGCFICIDKPQILFLGLINRLGRQLLSDQVRKSSVSCQCRNVRFGIGRVAANLKPGITNDLFNSLDAFPDL